MKYTTFMLFLLLLAMSSQAITLRYDFENADQLKDWKQLIEPEHPGGKWSVEGGVSRFTSQDNWCFANLLYIGDDTWKDYEVEYRFRIDKTFLPPNCANSYGVIGLMVHLQLGDKCRAIYTGPHDFNGDKIWESNYSGTITGSSLLGVGNSFSASNVISKPADLKEGVWYKSRVVSNGNQYEWFINNQPMWKFQGESPQFAYGAIGLYTRNIEASFDNVVIKGDTIPSMTYGETTSVQSHNKLITLWCKLKAIYL